MKKIILFLLFVISFETAIAQQDVRPNSSIDILKKMEGTIDKVYLDYFKNERDRCWKDVEVVGGVFALNLRVEGSIPSRLRKKNP